MESALTSPTRLAALRETGLLHSGTDPIFDRLTLLASKALRVPVSLVSLVSDDREYFKSQIGLPPALVEKSETPLSHSFCQHVVDGGKVFLVNDAREHALVRDNAAVSELGVVAYAGVPLRHPSGEILGSFCVIDNRPRVWTGEDVELLESLAAQAMTEIETRARARVIDEEMVHLRELEADHRRLTRLTVHDLNTPLHSLLLNIQTLPLVGTLNALQRDSLAIARRSGETLADMIRALLDIDSAERRGGALRTIDCSARSLVSLGIEVVAVLAAEKDITIDTQLQAGLPTVSCDRDRIIRVLVNLLGNAIKFTGVGGHIRVSTSVQHDDGRSMVLFTVADNGVGIAEHELDQIFREGVRGQAGTGVKHSWGLGLAFCKRVVEEHGGNIRVQSTVGSGSTFSFSIPFESVAEASS